MHDAQDPTQALIDVGLKERIDNFPAQLSGGEQQRGAVDMYFTEGMTIRKVVAELGYPSEGALAKWVREDPARHGRVQAFVYAGMQDECGQTRARGRAPRPRGARRGLHADERAAVFCQIFVGRFGVSFSPFERLFLGRFGFGQSCGLSVIA